MNATTANALAEFARLALTAAIGTSPQARRCSERLAGRCIAFETLGMRIVVHFEAGAVRVDAGDDPADATVRGSPAAVAATMASGVDSAADTAAVFGDVAAFEDFRDSFRPHLGPAQALAEDVGDALRLGGKVVESALEGIANAVRGGRGGSGSGAP